MLLKKSFAIALTVFVVSVSVADESLDCENAISTLEINACASIELDLAQREMEHYLQASLEHNADDPELVEAIQVAQKDWQAYYTSHCSSVYTQWREGTIRGVLTISCRTTLTKQRTHELWKNFLTYMDSTPPVLPEPKIFE